MFKHVGMFGVLVGFLAFTVCASPVVYEGEIDELYAPAGMVLIPAGSFEMGSADEEAYDAEQPVHTVNLDAFYMDVYEVTNAQFKAFVDANPEWQKSRIDRRFHNVLYLVDWHGNTYPFGKANHPVVWVSWYAAMAYAEWAGKRLPTEAEWEYAARGGLAGKKYPWGDTITANDANYDKHVDDTTPVGAYADNGYGLYDMAGNVREWCLDEYDADFYTLYNRPHTRHYYSWNPISSAVTRRVLLDNFASVRPFSFRVSRGGSWLSSATFLRVAYREGYELAPTRTSVALGFRCVRDVPR